MTGERHESRARGRCHAWTVLDGPAIYGCCALGQPVREKGARAREAVPAGPAGTVLSNRDCRLPHIGQEQEGPNGSSMFMAATTSGSTKICGVT